MLLLVRQSQNFHHLDWVNGQGYWHDTVHFHFGDEK